MFNLPPQLPKHPCPGLVGTHEMFSESSVGVALPVCSNGSPEQECSGEVPSSMQLEIRLPLETPVQAFHLSAVKTSKC